MVGSKGRGGTGSESGWGTLEWAGKLRAYLERGVLKGVSHGFGYVVHVISKGVDAGAGVDLDGFMIMGVRI